MRRDLFTEDHEAFRGLARDFVEKEVVPHYPEWEKGGRMPRDVFKQMGALGMLGMGASLFHLGRPLYAFRAFIGIFTSWLSREIVCFGAFAGLASLYAALP